MAIDNVFWGGKVADPRERGKDTTAIRALNEKIRDDERVDLSMIPITESTKLRPGGHNLKPKGRLRFLRGTLHSSERRCR
jgi:hypothetical protein